MKLKIEFLKSNMHVTSIHVLSETDEFYIVHNNDLMLNDGIRQ